MFTKSNIQRDVRAVQVAEGIRYQQRTAEDVRVFRNAEYMRMWRNRNAAGNADSEVTGQRPGG